MENQIDFVVLWVDGADPAWKKEKEEYAVVEGSDVGAARYREWGNLHFWFRGVERFAPWVRRIHFVTWGHLPPWLNTEHPKLHIVNHRDFMSAKYLPTFNTNPIELNLHRIAGLSEKFVYFNDDTFLINAVEPRDFFDGELPRDRFLMEAILPEEDKIKSIIFNDVKLINTHFSKRETLKKYRRKIYTWKNGKDGIRNFLLLPWKKFTGFHDDHLPLAFRKETFEQVWEQEPEILHQTCLRKFRNERDVSAWLMRYWALASGAFSPKVLQGVYDNICADDWQSPEVIRRQSCKMICCNDVGECRDFEQRKRTLIQAFEQILPERSEYEKEESEGKA